MSILQKKVFGLPVVILICVVILVVFIVSILNNNKKPDGENFASCRRPSVRNLEFVDSKKNKPILKNDMTKKDIKITCFYADYCYYSKKMVGNLIKGNNMVGYWDQIKSHCEKNGIDYEAKECENNPLNRALAGRLGVQGYPTCIITFKDNVAKKIVGAQPVERIMESIDEVKNDPEGKEKVPKDIRKKGLSVRIYYANWCTHSHSLLGKDKIPQASQEGEFKAIEEFCKNNDIELTIKEENNQDTKKEMMKLGINGFPHSVIFKDGRIEGEIPGSTTAEKFINEIKKHM